MAGGWSKDGAVQEQIDASIGDAVAKIRNKLNDTSLKPSLEFCEECDETIPAARREAIPGVRRCVKCQSEQDENEKATELYNRRGSKDSQLR